MTQENFHTPDSNLPDPLTRYPHETNEEFAYREEQHELARHSSQPEVIQLNLAPDARTEKLGAIMKLLDADETRKQIREVIRMDIGLSLEYQAFKTEYAASHPEEITPGPQPTVDQTKLLTSFITKLSMSNPKDFGTLCEEMGI